MGNLFSSKVDVPTLDGPKLDVSSVKEAAFVPLATAEAKEAELAGQIESTRQAAEEKLGELGGLLATTSWWKGFFKWGGIFLLILLVVFGVIFGYDYYALKNGKTPILLPSPPQAPPSNDGGNNKAVAPQKVSSGPSMLSRFTTYVTGSTSSGDLVSSLHDATTALSIPAANAPLSNQSQGAYGIQWWMFVKDWNYGFGKDKAVLTRADPTNTAIMNPSVSLHPTDNTLKISVSVFPTDASASKTEPAPATSSGAATDDVFVCEVPNIPLQAWFSVGASVFGKNLDVYIDGKLVKSCMLPGVPKPAVGNIDVSPNGGFSGYICNLYHYPRMLTPSDAMTFHSQGSSCSTDVSSSGISAPTLTGYSVKFGVYDSLGKQVQQYTF